MDAGCSQHVLPRHQRGLPLGSPRPVFSEKLIACRPASGRSRARQRPPLRSSSPREAGVAAVRGPPAGRRLPFLPPHPLGRLEGLLQPSALLTRTRIPECSAPGAWPSPQAQLKGCILPQLGYPQGGRGLRVQSLGAGGESASGAQAEPSGPAPPPHPGTCSPAFRMPVAPGARGPRPASRLPSFLPSPRPAEVAGRRAVPVLTDSTFLSGSLARSRLPATPGPGHGAPAARTLAWGMGAGG